MDDLLMDANLFRKQRLFCRINGGEYQRRFPIMGIPVMGINDGWIFDGRLQALILEHVPKSSNRKSELLYWYLTARGTSQRR